MKQRVSAISSHVVCSKLESRQLSSRGRGVVLLEKIFFNGLALEHFVVQAVSQADELISL
jgi:hypothetical protein